MDNGSVTIPVEEYNKLRDSFNNWNDNTIRAVVGYYSKPYWIEGEPKSEWIDHEIYYIGKDEAISQMVKEVQSAREYAGKESIKQYELKKRIDHMPWRDRLFFLFTGKADV